MKSHNILNHAAFNCRYTTLLHHPTINTKHLLLITKLLQFNLTVHLILQYT